MNIHETVRNNSHSASSRIGSDALLEVDRGLNGGRGIRDAAQFREGLRDGRSVWLDGRRIDDVTTADGFRGGVETMAALYGRQFDADWQDRMTAIDDAGVRISASYLMPKTRADLALKRSNTEVWARETLGFMGRFPDFCANLIVGLRNAAPVLARSDTRYGENAARYLDYCARNDLALTHALNDQFFDRTKKANEQPDPDLMLRVVRETQDGIIVRGLKNLATLSPICDEAIVYPNRPRGDGEEEQALAFAIPMNAPGLHIVCREAYGRGASSRRLPLSTRFDELDATLIFEDVLVPWERVFVYKDPLLVSRFIGMINPPWSGYVTLIRLVTKLETMVGVLELLSRYDGKESLPPIQIQLGAMVRDIAVLKACLRTMEEDAVRTDAGFLAPAASDAYRLFGVEASDRAERIMEDIAASALIPTGSETDFDIPEAGPLIERFFRGLAPSSAHQMRLMALAGDMTQSSFGGRTQLYERFHMGPPDMIHQRLYRSTQREAWVDRVEAFLDRM